jgi:hypothetical protein
MTPIERAAAGIDPVSLRVLSIGDDPLKRPSQKPPDKTYAPKDELPSEKEREIFRQLSALGAASETLKTVPASGFKAAEGSNAELVMASHAKVQRLDSALDNLKMAEVPDKPLSATNAAGPSSAIAQPWLLSHAAIHALSKEVQSTLAENGVDLGVQALPTVIMALDDKRTVLLRDYEISKIPAEKLMHVLGYKVMSGSAGDYVGWPADILPTGHGNIKPVGIGDLLVVKQHVLGRS